MAAGNFERCLAITLKWEGNYSNHPDDPGGPTMRGIIQREYDAFRKKSGKRTRPVRQIEEAELQTIYRGGYWDAMGCEELPSGFDLCVFDAAVNSGVGRARKWVEATAGATDKIEALCAARLDFLQRLGRLWRVFGAGWRRRVDDIHARAQRMAGLTVEPEESDTGELHAGMRGSAVKALQTRLRALGYPCGAVDGIYGEQTYRAVVLFQTDHDLHEEPGQWQPGYNAVLERAQHALPRRADATHKDLERAGDPQAVKLGWMQRAFAWLFGGSAAAQVFSSDASVTDQLTGLQGALEPLQGALAWVSSNKLYLIAAAAILGIIIVRLIRSNVVHAYRNFDYQGPIGGAK
jgi:lysozyme family protein